MTVKQFLRNWMLHYIRPEFLYLPSQGNIEYTVTFVTCTKNMNFDTWTFDTEHNIKMSDWNLKQYFDLSWCIDNLGKIQQPMEDRLVSGYYEYNGDIYYVPTSSWDTTLEEAIAQHPEYKVDFGVKIVDVFEGAKFVVADNEDTVPSFTEEPKNTNFGCSFMITDLDDNIVWATPATQHTVITKIKLKRGQYKLIELKTPRYHDINFEPIIFTVRANSEVLIPHDPYGVRIDYKKTSNTVVFQDIGINCLPSSNLLGNAAGIIDDYFIGGIDYSKYVTKQNNIGEGLDKIIYSLYEKEKILEISHVLIGDLGSLLPISHYSSCGYEADGALCTFESSVAGQHDNKPQSYTYSCSLKLNCSCSAGPWDSSMVIHDGAYGNQPGFGSEIGHHGGSAYLSIRIKTPFEYRVSKNSSTNTCTVYNLIIGAYQYYSFSMNTKDINDIFDTHFQTEFPSDYNIHQMLDYCLEHSDTLFLKFKEKLKAQQEQSYFSSYMQLYTNFLFNNMPIVYNESYNEKCPHSNAKRVDDSITELPKADDWNGYKLNTSPDGGIWFGSLLDDPNQTIWSNDVAMHYKEYQKISKPSLFNKNNVRYYRFAAQEIWKTFKGKYIYLDGAYSDTLIIPGLGIDINNIIDITSGEPRIREENFSKVALIAFGGQTEYQSKIEELKKLVIQ